MNTCAICKKDFDYVFQYELKCYHKHDNSYTEFQANPKQSICSKSCIATWAESICSMKDHRNDTIMAIYEFPLGFCDKCGHATHPTEFCELTGDVDQKMIDYHDNHLAGQGAMVKMQGKIVEIFLGPGWVVEVEGIELSRDVVQLEPELEKRAPLAVLWKEQDSCDSFAESIALPDSRHTEKRDFYYKMDIKPCPDTNGDRYYHVFQILEHLEGREKVFFPYFLHSVNCWFPVEGETRKAFKRWFKAQYKTDRMYSDDDVNDVYEQIFLPEKEIDVEDNYENFMKGVEAIQMKRHVVSELKLSLAEMEKLSCQEVVYEGEGRVLVEKTIGDGGLSNNDIDFLKEKGFSERDIEIFSNVPELDDPSDLMDKAFIGHMESIDPNSYANVNVDSINEL